MIDKKKIEELKKLENEPITTKQRNVIFGGIILVFFIFIVMFAGEILTGLAALIGLVITTLVLFFGLRALKAADPMIKQKTRNAVLKSMYAEAAKNAIQQLGNQVIDNAKKLANARKSRDKMGGLLGKLENSLKEENKGKPIYKKKVKTIKTVSEAYEVIKANVDKAAVANMKFEEKVNDYREFNNFSNIANEAMDVFAMNGGDKLSDMLSTHAFDSIDNEFNSAIANIENSANDMSIDQGN